MPAVFPRQSLQPFARPVLVRFAVGLSVLAFAVLVASGQQPKPPPAEPPRAGAFKLPDGTVIFFSKNPDEANPPIDGVMLSPQEYRALVEQSEQLKKLKAGPRPQAPSGCQIRGRVEARGERSVAALSLTYAIRTTRPQTPVALGCQQAFPLAARLNAEKLPPVLIAGEDGLAVIIERPGDHTLTLDLEVPVMVRGMGREIGYELALPRAAITTLAVDPPAGVARTTVGVRTAADRQGELIQTSGEPAVVTGRPEKPVPLGPIELLVISWEAPATQSVGPDATTSAEHDILVRVDEVQIETTAKIRLRGSVREWVIALPAGADVAAARVSPPAGREPPTPSESTFGSANSSPVLVRPTDPEKSFWLLRPPDGPGPDWELTVTTRQARPKPDEPNHHGPYRVGPISVLTASRQSGTVKVHAAPTVKLRDFKPAPAVRRSDVPPLEESLVAFFRFSTLGDPTGKAAAIPLLQFEARQVPGSVRVQPTYELTRTDGGWRLRLTAKVSPIRTELEQVVVDLPPGWEGVEAGPVELVDEVQVLTQPGPTRRLVLGLLTPQRGAFELTLTAAHLVPNGAREVSLLLPRFPDATESGSRVLATVQEPLEVRGTVMSDGPAGGSVKLQPVSTGGSSKASTRAAGQLDRGVSRVDLTWHPYRPELSADVRAEVGLQDRQAVVSQTIRFRSTESDSRPVRIKGPAGVGGLRASPPLEPIGPGEWAVRPPADAREFTLSLSYAIPVPPRRADQSGPVQFSVALLWPEMATRVETVVRVWGAGTGRRVDRFEGPWHELPPEPAGDRDSLPWLTLAGTGAPVPLVLELTDPADGAATGVVIDRTLIQGWVADDGAVAVRARYVLSRWPVGGIELDLPVGATPTIMIDDRKAEPTPVPGGLANGSRVRLPVPAGPGTRSTLRLDVRYQSFPARSLRGDIWQTAFPPPSVVGAVHRSSPRWQVIHPTSTVLLFPGRELSSEHRWAWRRASFGPVAGFTTEELDRWIQNGSEAGTELDESLATVGPNGAGVTASQPLLGPVKSILVPRVWWVTGVSLLVLAMGFGLARLRRRLLGPVLAVVGIVVAVFGVGWPQPAAEAAAAAQPGLVLLAILLAASALAKWYYHWRVVHLPGFTRDRIEPVITSVTGSSPSGPRSSQNGPVAVREESGTSPPLAPTGS